jgi:PadR family transcriptional regulator, regulatory protein PadR
LYSGLIRLHVLYHASKEPIFGLEMIEELGRHGYRLSSGTMYPLLHGLENKGLLRSSRTGRGPNSRLVYRATAAGRSALTVAKDKVRELFSELFEDVMNQRVKRQLNGENAVERPKSSFLAGSAEGDGQVRLGTR